LAAAGFLVALVVGAACGLGEALQDPGDPVDMTTANIAGTWHAGTERFITFAEDGTFTALNLPPGVFHLTGPGSPIDASGRHALDILSPTDPGPHASVKLSIDDSVGAGRGGAVELTALRPGDGQVYLVFLYVGELGNMTTGYLHCADDCAPPARSGIRTA
jgi:hypothetical protein